MRALLGEEGALACTEAVLLVGDDQAGGGEFHAVRKKGVRADDHLQAQRRLGGGQ